MSSLPNGLAAGTVALADEDAAAYGALLSRLVKSFNPVGDDEHALLQAIVDTDWRLQRIPALEAGIYAVGRLEFAAVYADEQNDRIRRQLLDAKVFLVYQRQLNNLSMQEARLRRQREKDVIALRALQELRSTQSLASPAPAHPMERPLSERQAPAPASLATHASAMAEPSFGLRPHTPELVPANP